VVNYGFSEIQLESGFRWFIEGDSHVDAAQSITGPMAGKCLFGQNLFSNYAMNNSGHTVFSNYSLKLSPLADKAARAVDNKWPAFVLNLLLGAGIGSFVQGDTLGGVIGACGEVGGFIFVLVGVIPKQEQVYYGYYTTELSFPNIGLSYVGLGVLMGTRIFELVRPFIYADRFLLSVAPNFDVNGQRSLTAMAKIKI
jgi:hypothetical protein